MASYALVLSLIGLIPGLGIRLAAVVLIFKLARQNGQAVKKIGVSLHGDLQIELFQPPQGQPDN